jgi:hypothetical protein
MKVFVIDNNNIPVEPINEILAKEYLDKKKAIVVRKSPLVLKLKWNKTANTLVRLNINIMSNRIEFVVVSYEGDIFYIEKLNITRDIKLFLSKLEGILRFIREYLPINTVFVFMNTSAIWVIDRNKRMIKYLLDESLNILTVSHHINKCYGCGAELKNEYNFYKILPQYNIIGNTILLCNSCMKKHTSKIKKEIDIFNKMEFYFKQVNKVVLEIYGWEN